MCPANTSPESGATGHSRPLNRREFLIAAGATTAAFTILNPRLVRGSQANAKIALGLIGCGGRGTWLRVGRRR